MAEFMALSAGAAVVVLLTFIAFEILQAPLVIVDAKTDSTDPAEPAGKKILTISVQGPIVDLHKGLSRLLHRRVRYQAKGTGLEWLDYDQQKSNAIKVRNIARRKLLLQDMHVPFDCATCRGSLHATEIGALLLFLTVCIVGGAMLPVIIKVAVASGNHFAHVFVSLVCKFYSFVMCCTAMLRVLRLV